VRRLIVNADDFGQSPGINAGIARAHEQGIVSSASLMVRWPAAPAAADYARTHPSLGVGLHLDLCEWTCVDGRWSPLYEVVSLDDVEMIGAELSRQLERFRELVGRDPTHVDSHQHVHQEPLILAPVLGAAKTLGVPVRGHDARVRYDGRFYGHGRHALPCHQQISRPALTSMILSLPEGTTEWGCHPAVGLDVESVYAVEREMELRVLCDPAIRAAVNDAGIQLISFRDVGP